MDVRLVSITPEVEKTIAYCARVSSSDPNNPNIVGLLKYCISHKHWSIFEMGNLCIEVKTSRGISAQILRHRSFNFQEFCIAGDSKISIIKSNGDTMTQTIEHLYKIQKNSNFKGKMLRVYDENTKQFTSATLKEVFKTGAKPVFKITMEDGKTITSTKEHKYLTNLGFLPLEEIVGLDPNNCSMSKVGIIAVNGEECYKSKEWLKEKRDAGLTNKEIGDLAGVTDHTIKKWLRINELSLTAAEAAKRGAATSLKIHGGAWNKGKFGYKTKLVVSEEHKEAIRVARSGSKSNWWKGGVDRGFRQLVWDWTNKHRKEILEKYNYTCQECRTRGGKLQLHHITPVHVDKQLAMELSNIIPVHKPCHDKIHGKDRINWQELGTRKRPTLIPKWKKIVSIQYLGEIETYDLEVDHSSHNYIANKIVVHNSQRYSAVTEEGVEIYAARRQDVKNRQNSVDDLPQEIKEEWERRQTENWKHAFEHYQWALNNLLAKEQARFVLPLGTQTKLYMNGTIRSWIHYLETRDGNGTQKEHQEIAQAIKAIFAKEMPIIAQALGWV